MTERKLVTALESIESEEIRTAAADVVVVVATVVAVESVAVQQASLLAADFATASHPVLVTHSSALSTGVTVAAVKMFADRMADAAADDGGDAHAVAGHTVLCVVCKTAACLAAGDDGEDAVVAAGHEILVAAELQLVVAASVVVDAAVVAVFGADHVAFAVQLVVHKLVARFVAAAGH